MCALSDMITGLFSFSCTLRVVHACLSVCCLAQEELPTAVPKLIALHRFLRRAWHLLGELASFNLSCTAVNYQGSYPAQWLWCWLRVGGKGGSELSVPPRRLWKGQASLFQGRAVGYMATSHECVQEAQYVCQIPIPGKSCEKCSDVFCLLFSWDSVLE